MKDNTGNNNRCKECGKLLYDDHSGTGLPDLCKCYEAKEKSVFGAYGWICPVCGAGNSPFTTTCPCTRKYEVTC